MAAESDAAGRKPPKDRETVETAWMDDYCRATQAAEKQSKMLLVLFIDEKPGRIGTHFRKKVLADPQVARRMDNYVCLRLPLEATIRCDGKPLRLLDHQTFSGMQKRPGLAILDFTDRNSRYHGCVVSTFPFSATHCYSIEQMKAILDLPAGSPAARSAAFRTAMARHAAPPAATDAPAAERQPDAEPLAGVAWMKDYAEATRAAEHGHKMLLILFRNESEERFSRFESTALADPEVRRLMQDYVCLQMPCDAKITSGGKEVQLLKAEAFREMLGRPGLAVVDYQNEKSQHYGLVVSAFPLTPRLQYTPQQVKVILRLPPGTLTQRTLIYAVRTHPDAPKSTNGQWDGYLTEEARQSSQYQADIRLQGHHQWNSRFQRITSRLPGGLLASEVCAESWPGENLVEAAIECVRCWRLSSGHWSAVRAFHRVYGYDMKRGRNGVWYATGIFGKKGR